MASTAKSTARFMRTSFVRRSSAKPEGAASAAVLIADADNYATS